MSDFEPAVGLILLGCEGDPFNWIVAGVEMAEARGELMIPLKTLRKIKSRPRQAAQKKTRRLAHLSW